jgi:hypothetical protein
MTRTLAAIAEEIEADWSTRGNGVNYAARPYLDAMKELISISDRYYQDNARGVVLYFLSNASSWRGETAKRIKAELRAMLAAK